MSRVLLLSIFLPLLLLIPAGGPAQPAEEHAAAPTAPVVVLQIDDQIITPVTVRYLRRGLREAREANAQVVVIMMDTPGGLMDSTREIAKDILGSDIPVVVYVAPTGARAASAGLFITMASHIAAMAPGTHIGAATPVQMGGMPGAVPETEAQDDTTTPTTRSAMEAKVLEDAKAWVRTLAELRGRNAEWAVSAVVDAQTITASEALELNVIEHVAADMPDLMNQIDGKTVNVVVGERTLATRNAPVQTILPWWGERLLAVISNPNIAFLLMILGFYGILFEFYSPGWGVGGTVGIICLLLAFFGLSVLPVNYAGLALILLAIALFAAEFFVVSFGALTVGGLVCLVLGALMLIDSPVGAMQVSVSVVLPIAVATALIVFFLAGSVIRAHSYRPQTGGETMIGKLAKAKGDFAEDGERYRGRVNFRGELWNSVSDGAIADGQTVEIIDRDGLTLRVKLAGAPAQPREEPGTPQSNAGGKDDA